ncbi:MAG: alpha-1,2-fucosyltransferase [Acutalibacteraceae bacterium]
MASALEYGFKFRNYNFEYSDLFEMNNPKCNKIAKIKKTNIAVLACKVTNRLKKILPENIITIKEDNTGEEVAKLLDKKVFNGKIIFYRGWPYYDRKSLIKHKAEIKDFFTPKEQYRTVVESQISKLRETYDVVIGVHIRRGDYKNFLGGKYYFDIDVFAKVCQNFRDYLENTKTAFIITSNEKIDGTAFSDLGNDIYFSQGSSGVEDNWLLSLCDYIIGVPSTFNGWASFIGNTPLYWIQNKDDLRITEDRLNIYMVDL